MGVTLNLAGYWCIGLPLAYILGFRMSLGVLGLWIALAVAAGLQAIVFLVAMLRFDWEVEVERARSLTARHDASAPDLGKLEESKDFEPEERQALLVTEV
jgi:MATE family multidrug resistance protein